MIILFNLSNQLLFLNNKSVNNDLGFNLISRLPFNGVMIKPSFLIGPLLQTQLIKGFDLSLTKLISISSVVLSNFLI